MDSLTSLPPLGFGLMRLQETGTGELDMALLRQMADLFLARGFGYFDTAYVYLNQRSEGAFKAAVADRYPRDRYAVATKLPLFTAASQEECRRIMETSLQRLGTGYVDFWLVHSLRKESMEKADQLGVWELMKEYKAAGKAKHIGFSYHDSPELLDAYLDRHPEVEFVQLQVNYLDWEDENIRARACYEAVRRHGLPVIVMEPIKGGSLATGNPQVRALMGDSSPAAMALRWVAEKPGVMMVLSGMNDMAQMEENTTVMAQPAPLTEAERSNMAEAARVLRAIPRIPCTDCKYCQKGCPAQIRIPWILQLYSNTMVYANPGPARNEFVRFRKDSGLPSQCVGCGQCENVCPQHLPIPELMTKAAGLLE